MKPTFCIEGFITKIGDLPGPTHTAMVDVAISTDPGQQPLINNTFTVTFTKGLDEVATSFCLGGYLKATGWILQNNLFNGTVSTFYYVTEFDFTPF